MTVVFAYDSQYTRQMCDVGEYAPLPAKNRTIVALCRRLLLEAAALGVRVTWVKVRGHSTADANHPTVIGNEHADTAADEGQKGRTKGEVDVATYMRHELGR